MIPTADELATWLDVPTTPALSAAKAAQMTMCIDAAVADMEERCSLPAEWTPNVRLACLMHAARLYKRKNSPEGVAGFGEFGTVRVSRFDPDVEDLLSPFFRFGFA